MTPELHQELHANPKKRGDRDRLSATRTHLGRFVLGERVDNERFMWELEDCPQGIWEFKVRKLIVKDQIRVFGIFAGPNWFLATHMRSRNYIGHDDAKWEGSIEKVQLEWSKIFPDRRWFIADAFNEYVTFNGEDRRGL